MFWRLRFCKQNSRIKFACPFQLIYKEMLLLFSVLLVRNVHPLPLIKEKGLFHHEFPQPLKKIKLFVHWKIWVSFPATDSLKCTLLVLLYYSPSLTSHINVAYWCKQSFNTYRDAAHVTLCLINGIEVTGRVVSKTTCMIYIHDLIVYFLCYFLALDFTSSPSQWLHLGSPA